MRSWKDSLALPLARLGPAGLSPVAPGTAGSAVAAVAAPWLFLPLGFAWRLVVLGVLFFVGVWAADRAEKFLGDKDPSSVVVDELVGQWLTLMPLGLVSTPGAWPWGLSVGPAGRQTSVLFLLLGFALFRLFDIWKPGPVRASENWLPGGGGIMVDDVVAGLLALAVLAALCVIAMKFFA